MTNYYLKRYDDAIEDFGAVLELDANEKTSLFGRNVAYSTQGDMKCFLPFCANVYRLLMMSTQTGCLIGRIASNYRRNDQANG